MRVRGWLRALTLFTATVTPLAVSGFASAGPTDYQQTIPLVWVMVWLSVGGAALTFGVLVWALYRFRDPATRGRRYG